ncbi:helix-turn-helix domain-containing protein [Micromonospora arborensis]|uniref:TetR/AcrR family transcriptional regulator n=1 Tax=Micromonospora arborensis TaxID=2116518 RepID=UPI0033E7D519
MPKLWTDTIEAHRAAVRDATLDAAAALIAEHGLTALTMSRIAETTGIGRATLYKYFPDIDAVLRAWHERQVRQHLAHLMEIRDDTADPSARLRAVLHAYARMSGHSHSGELGAELHRSEQVTAAHQQLRAFLSTLIADAAQAKTIRDDIAPDELAAFALNALAADAAAEHLVELTFDAMQARC